MEEGLMGAAAAIEIATQAKQKFDGGLDAASQAAYQEQADLQNQQLAEQAGADASARGGQQAGRIRMQASQLAARQRVAFANSGVDITTGTPVQVAAGTAAMGELDAQTARNNAAREAWGYEVTAARYGQQAQLAEQQRVRGLLSSVAGSGGEVAGSISGATQSGAFSSTAGGS
jgi:hypothetical protein